MAERTLPGIGLTAFWDLGSDGWNTGMDANLRLLSALVQPRALDHVGATPGSPVNGDIYLFTAAHATQPNKIAIYDDGVWVYVTPASGWLVYDVALANHRKFTGSAWEAFATGGGGSAVFNQTGTSYTAALGDANSYVRFANASPVSFTIPPNSSVAFPVGTVIEFEQAGAGAVTVVAGSGVTINSRSSDLTLAGQYAVAFVKKVATNTWIMNGDL